MTVAVVLALAAIVLAATIDALRPRVTAPVVPVAITAAPSAARATLAPAAPTAAPAATVAATFADAWDYCAAVGTVDRPDARYTGEAMPGTIFDALSVAEKNPRRFADPAARRAPIPWRCMDGAVWACDPGANLNCGAANTDRQPTAGMLDWCAQHPDGVLPAYVSGHETIYAWSCKGGQPMIDRQPLTVDARGFVSNFWYRLDRP